MEKVNGVIYFNKGYHIIYWGIINRDKREEQREEANTGEIIIGVIGGYTNIYIYIYIPTTTDTTR